MEVVLVELVLEVHRCLVAERAVAACPVVIFSDVVEKVVRGFGSGGVAAAFFGESHAFPFVGGVEAFHPRVVVRIARSANARFDAGHGQMHGANLPPQPRIGSFAFAGFSLDPGMIARALHIQGGAELG